MSAYVPGFVYGFTGWDEYNQPMHGLVEWPEHLKPRQEARPAETPDIALTKKGEAYAERALAEADGVFFLTVDGRDRQSIATSIEKLINMLDQMEPDCDLEPDEGTEPSLGWPEGGRGCAPLDKTMRHDGDLEQDNSDCEPSLGAPEHGSPRSQVSWAAGDCDDREEDADTELNGDETDHSLIAEELGSVGRYDASGRQIARSMLAKVRVRKMMQEAGASS